MFDNINMKVTVSVEELLATVKGNRELHAANYKAAKEGFIILLGKELAKKMSDLEAGKKVDLYIKAQKPENYTKSYDEVIGMLEMSQAESLEIDQKQYRQLILDKWDWSERWSQSNSVYLSAAPQA